MKRLILIVIVILFFSVPCWASQYCLVENGEIIKGPQQLPTAWGNTSGLNHLDEAGLISRGWYRYIPGEEPAHEDTQYTTFVSVVNGTTVIRSYTIHDYTQEQLDAIAERKAVQDEISTNSPMANMTVAQAETYIDNNVTDLASAKAALKKIARMIIALRDRGK